MRSITMPSEACVQLTADENECNLLATVSTQRNPFLTLSALGARPWHSTLFKDGKYEAPILETKLQVRRATLGVTHRTGLRL